MKPLRYFLTVLTALAVCSNAALIAVASNPSDNQPVMALAIEENLQSRAGVLMDAGTGQILIEKLPDERMPIASVTKLMTMLVVLEALEDGRIKRNEEVVASPHACSYGGSQIYLEPGERFSVEDMMMAVTIKSANDAAIALAEHVAGSESAFVALMNKKANELGMKNSHFINACGLDSVSVTGVPGDTGYSSAKDVAILSREVIKYHGQLKEWLTTRITYLQRAKGPVELFNTNHRFIRNFPGADGLKTGLTDDAGWCLSATAERSNFRLIAVVLGAPSDEIRYQDVSTLLNYGFANFVGKDVVEKGQVLAEVDLNRGEARKVKAVASEDLAVLMKKGDSLEDLQLVVETQDKIFAPIQAGHVLGSVKVIKGEKVLGEVELVAEQSVKKLTFFGNFTRMFSELVR